MDPAGLLFLAVAALVFAVPLANRIGVPYPVLLTVVGILAALAPGFPEITLNPDLILPVLLPPLLYAAAQRTSWAQLRAQWRSILVLAVALVVVSALAVGALLTALLPQVPWAIAFAVGAATAPPDPVAATAVARQIGLPHRIVAVIEGEGLVNDATALTLYNVALTAAAAGGAISWYGIAGRFVFGGVGGVAVGLLVAWLAAKVLAPLTDPMLQGAFTVALPYAAYLAATALGASGVLAVLVAGLGLRRVSYRIFDPESRLAGRAFWETADLLLTAVAFIIVGLELRPILRGAGHDLGRQLGIAAAVCGVLVAVRMAWLIVAGLLARRLRGRTSAAPAAGRRSAPVPATWREGVVVGWAGMRGVVTVAAALGLPSNTPARGALLLVAFVTVAGTLILPGLTLAPVVRRLGLGGTDHDAGVRDVAVRVMGAVLIRVDELYSDGVLDEAGARRWRNRCTGMLVALSPGAENDPRLADVHAAQRDRLAVNTELLGAAQQEALRLRRDDRIDPAAVDQVLRDLDRRLLQA
ncbi:MAG TPA: sodium:proton antiporter [Micromonosporaceae bacterium]|nr:sodium:proton antiporter [Micromonosporaceae bacterium]